MKANLPHPEFLHLTGTDGRTLYGCSQEWYTTAWQQRAGCGPSVLANMLLYLTRSGQITMSGEITSLRDALQLMERAWQSVTPGVMGLHSAMQFKQGADALFTELGSGILCQTMNVPPAVPWKRSEGPKPESVSAFIREGLAAGIPVAFLNLSRGSLKNLESWHWVTVIAIAEGPNGKITLDAYDNAGQLQIDLSSWLATSSMGGGFVSFIHEKKAQI